MSLPHKLFEVLIDFRLCRFLKFEFVGIKTCYVKLKQLCRNTTRVGDFYFLKIYRIYKICGKIGIEVKFEGYRVKRVDTNSSAPAPTYI